jgi:hypothetical protein
MPTSNSIKSYILTDHAKEEMARRHISETMIDQVLTGPEQTEIIRIGRVICQSRIELGEPPKAYLLRVFVDIDREPAEVVTVYLTSKIRKYWRAEP